MPHRVQCHTGSNATQGLVRDRDVEALGQGEPVPTLSVQCGCLDENMRAHEARTGRNGERLGMCTLASTGAPCLAEDHDLGSDQDGKQRNLRSEEVDQRGAAEELAALQGEGPAIALL